MSTTPTPFVQSCEMCGQPLGRKHWLRSYKVRCAWLASFFPIVAACVWVATEMLIPTVLITAAMAPFMALGLGETWHDGIKLKGPNGNGGSGE